MHLMRVSEFREPWQGAKRRDVGWIGIDVMTKFDVECEFGGQSLPVCIGDCLLLLTSRTVNVGPERYLTFEVEVMPKLGIVDDSYKIQLAERSCSDGWVDVSRP